MNSSDEFSKNSGSQAFATELDQFKIRELISDLSPHEQKLMDVLEHLGPKRLKGWRKGAQRLLQENIATHNVFDLFEPSRDWHFDPIPLVIGSEEWSLIEQGLIQRAELLNRILADIYGPRTVIEKGLLPPELIYCHNGFLLPCAGVIPPGQRHLNAYSANLARGKDGRFWVLEDRSQPALGSGYALENRIVMARSFPRLFKDFQVHRLAMYYRALRQNLVQMAPQNKAEPFIVILTPGPEDAAYFEHGYLATYLGYPLVQGGDLVVRDGCLWLKSLGGLRQVDVVLRRLADDLCDPLELRGNSLFGVPGLLDVVRQGNVSTANAIGTDIIENPALLAFLPGLCRHFLGEELRLPSVATWWCGQPREREFVLNNLDKLMVKPIHPISGCPRMIPGESSREELEAWRNRIEENPHLFVGQELATISTVPAYVSDKIESKSCMINTFLTAHEDSYVAMPGGISRVETDESSLLNPRMGGCVKDTWVLTPEPEKQVNLWRNPLPDQTIEPLLAALPSRAAENLFWAGRYAERTEATSRLMRSILNKLREYNEFRDPDDRRNLDHLLRALTEVTSTFPGFAGEGAEKKLADPRAELLSLARDVKRPGTLRASLQGLGRSTYAVRDYLPADAWRVVDNMQQNWHPKLSLQQIGGGRLNQSINQLITQLAAFSGLAHENMSREGAWLLLNIGRRLERAQNLIALLRATLVPCYDPTVESQMMEAVLATSNSLIVFRRRYRSFMQLSTVLELLLMDENYPRALAFQLKQLQMHIDHLPRDQAALRPQKDEQLISEAISELEGTDHRQLTQLSSSESIYPLLERFLSGQKERLVNLSENLVQLYFSPVVPPQQMGAISQKREAS
ncbi:MAG: hypothetical protein C0623_14490 [Desulfuromonas sp.]|nr:MAG: hypothetical protein C0623_14490 [Desulfuromonas sp.]